MPTIMPHSELLRRAVVHVNDMRKEHPDQALCIHIDDAAMRFNLSPLDVEALSRLFATVPDATEQTTAK